MAQPGLPKTWGECHPAPGTPPGWPWVHKASPGAEMPLEPHKLQGTGLGKERGSLQRGFCPCPGAEQSLRSAVAAPRAHYVLPGAGEGCWCGGDGMWWKVQPYCLAPVAGRRHSACCFPEAIFSMPAAEW